MPLTRRNFLVSGSLSLAAGALSPLLVQAAKSKPRTPADFKDWGSVRREFELAPDYIHLALFFLASHPRAVRQAIEQYREKIDANPFVAVDSAIFEPTNESIPLQVCQAIASYIGGDPQHIALTQNTTTGLALLYHGLPLREGDEILTTTHDHYVHHESIRLATGRCGATWRKIPLFDSYNSISPDEIAERVRKAIGPKTRAVGVTWVHSSSGVRLPIARIAESISDANRGREENDRVLLIVDGVHGLGVEDPSITALGCDAFAAGTHKWMLGPRGTGFVWAKPCSLAENASSDSEFLFARTFRSLGAGTCSADSGARCMVFTGWLSGFRTLLGVASSYSFSSEHRPRSNHSAHTRVERSNEGRTCPDAEHSALHAA